MVRTVVDVSVDSEVADVVRVPASVTVLGSTTVTVESVTVVPAVAVATTGTVTSEADDCV